MENMENSICIFNWLTTTSIPMGNMISYVDTYMYFIYSRTYICFTLWETFCFQDIPAHNQCDTEIGNAILLYSMLSLSKDGLFLIEK